MEQDETQGTIIHPVTVEDTTQAKLIIADEERNALLTVTNSGHIRTSSFDSANIPTSTGSAQVNGKRISQLTQASDITGAELIPFELNGGNGAVSIDDIRAKSSTPLVVDGTDAAKFVVADNYNHAVLTVDNAGNIRTDAFNSANIKNSLDSLQGSVDNLQDSIQHPVTVEDTTQAKLIIADEERNALLTVTNSGHIRTSSFDSANIQASSGSVTVTHPVTVMDTDLADLIIADENRRAILSVVNGHIRTEYFDSSNIQANSVDPLAPNPYDMLNGKTWYVLGDSFSEGDWTGSVTPTFTEGLYAGQKKVYPYFIGNRTGIEVHNLAKCGMTMAQSTLTMLSVYQRVPSNADYVTIYIGINDNHQGKPIGSEDSMDTSTFMGAYNTVLQWLVTNCPYAHIGVIVSPSSNEANWSQYDAATRAAARRYGIPILDIGGGADAPYFLRQTEMQGVLDSVRTLRNQQYRVSSTNLHPNERAHELQSHIIEQFLRRI